MGRLSTSVSVRSNTTTNCTGSAHKSHLRAAIDVVHRYRHEKRIGFPVVLQRIVTFCLALGGSLLNVERVCAQNLGIQGFEVTPFIGGRFGGTFEIQPDGTAEVRASLNDAISYGVSAGVRFDDLSMIEFSWTRAKSGLRFETGTNPPTTSL